MKYNTLVVLFLLLFSFVAAAQNKESVIFLKDGTQFQGRVTSQTDEKVTVTKRKDAKVFEMDDVDKIVRWKDLPSQALKNSVGISVNSLINSTICFNYERPLPSIHKKLSVGGSFSFSPAKFIAGQMAGFDISPMARWYITGEANNYGFYVQLKFSVGYRKAYSGLTYPKLLDGTPTEYTLLKDNFFSFGIGPSIGYQFKFKNPHWAIDMNLGLRYMTPDKTELQVVRYDYGGAETLGEPYITNISTENGLPFAYGFVFAAGSPFDLKVGVNYRF